MTEPTVNSEFFEQALSLAKTVGTTKLTRMILEERNELTPEKAENIDSQITQLENLIRKYIRMELATQPKEDNDD